MHYDHLRTLAADFTETFRGMGMDRTESGALWLKKSGKMRWEYRSPQEKLFLDDGKIAWFYVPGEGRVRKTSMQKLEDLRSPLAFLLGKTRLEKELRGLSLASDVPPITQGNIVLRGVPGGLGIQASEVLLEITPDSHISRIEIEGVDGAVTEYRFSNQREDITLPDDRFRFVPPPGIEVVEGDLGQ
ncbi:MAG: outer membrane lipoprotein carrier protein LolA [Acidobacteriales bacterium]|nr:outer membrane lipoprotein carrier protein LolA [Terriglobales bacterium]